MNVLIDQLYWGMCFSSLSCPAPLSSCIIQQIYIWHVDILMLCHIVYNGAESSPCEIFPLIFMYHYLRPHLMYIICCEPSEILRVKCLVCGSLPEIWKVFQLGNEFWWPITQVTFAHHFDNLLLLTGHRDNLPLGTIYVGGWIVAHDYILSVPHFITTDPNEENCSFISRYVLPELLIHWVVWRIDVKT